MLKEIKISDIKVDDLAEFGRHGGLCELPQKGSADREPLRDIFFALMGSKGESHPARRQSLLLTLYLCRQFSADDWQLTEGGFAGAVYYSEVANDESRLAVAVPPQLRDIATRWRMFYFHHFMSVALEGLFSWLVSFLNVPNKDCGTATVIPPDAVLRDAHGTILASLVAEVGDERVESPPIWVIQEGRLTYEPGGDGSSSAKSKVEESGVP